MSNLFTTWQTATTEHCKARWSCGKPGEHFRCGFCGHKFVEGDLFKSIYTNDLPEATGNPLACDSCRARGKDEEGLRQLWIWKSAQFRQMAENQFWWFAKNAS